MYFPSCGWVPKNVFSKISNYRSRNYYLWVSAKNVFRRLLQLPIINKTNFQPLQRVYCVWELKIVQRTIHQVRERAAQHKERRQSRVVIIPYSWARVGIRLVWARLKENATRLSCKLRFKHKIILWNNWDFYWKDYRHLASAVSKAVSVSLIKLSAINLFITFLNKCLTHRFGFPTSI